MASSYQWISVEITGKLKKKKKLDNVVITEIE